MASLVRQDSMCSFRLSLLFYSMLSHDFLPYLTLMSWVPQTSFYFPSSLHTLSVGECHGSLEELSLPCGSDLYLHGP